MHLFGEEFLDVLIAETNLLEGKIRKVTLEVAVGWKPINHKELIVFWGLTNSMGLMINKSMKALWNTKDCPRSPPAFGAVFAKGRLP